MKHSKLYLFITVVFGLTFSNIPNVYSINWATESIDSYGIVGKYASITLDMDGYMHVSYYDDTNDNLKYAYQDVNGWHVETVDSDGNVGEWTSIKIDSKNFPHISYYDNTNDDLKYAYKNESGWYAYSIDTPTKVGRFTSIVLDENDLPHISYNDETAGDLKYAFWDGDQWNVSVIDEKGGEITSIQLDSFGFPHIAYYQSREVTYAYKDNLGWHFETVSDNNSGYAGFTQISLCLDKVSNKPHIAARYYFYSLYKYLQYFYKENGQWKSETLDKADVWCCSMVLDVHGKPHICYGSKEVLKYAVLSEMGWSKQTVTTANTNYTSIDLNYYKEPFIGYYEDDGDNLKVARKESYGPEAFSLYSPENGIWTMPQPEFRWYPASLQGYGLSRYELWINNVVTKNNIPPTRSFAALDESLPDGWHSWRVRAVLPDGSDIWSIETWSFNADGSPPANFNLKYPQNNSWTSNNQPELCWHPSADMGSGLLKYQLYVDDILYDDNISAEETSTISSIVLADGAHSWYIVAMDSAQYSTQSNQTWTFKIDTAPPNSFSLFFPTNYSWTANSTPTFSWDVTTDDGIGLSKYQLIINENVIIDSIKADITTVSLTPSQALTDGSHYWKIKAVDLLGNARGSDSRILNVDLTPPVAFSLSSPSDSSFANFPTPNFSWKATTDEGSGVYHYQLWIDDSLNIDSLNLTTTAPSAPLCEGYHSWFVKAIDKVGNERSTQKWMVICEWNSPSQFELLFPENGDTVISRPLFRWRRPEDSGSGIDKYQLWIDNSLNKDNIPAADTFYKVENDLSSENHSNHTWFVKAFDKAGNESSSKTWSFVVLPTGVNSTQKQLPDNFELSQNHPNPFNPETTIEYQLPRSCHVVITIYNTIGQEIKTLIHGERQAGYHQIFWDGKDSWGRKVGTGIYLYQLKTDDFIAVKKMIMIQ